MKKIIALLLIAATLLSFAACKGDGGEVNTDPIENANDFAANQAKLEAEYSKKAAEKAAEESEVQQEIDEYIKEVGKTKKKTQLVIELDWPLGRKYYKFEFNKKGEFKTQIKYIFYDKIENYNASLEIEKNKENTKILDKDKDMKMLVIRSDGFKGKSFDEMYATYSREDVKELGYTIVE